MLSVKNNRSIVIFIFFVIFLFLSSPVIGEETTHSKNAAYQTTESVNHEGSHSSDKNGDLTDLLYRYINFAVLVIILFVVVKKLNIMSYFSNRSEEIKKRFEDLKRDKEEAEKRYKEIEQQLKNFEAKKNDILEQYKREGISEKDKIISEAKERVKQIIEQSEMTIQQEIESARNQLKQEIIEIAAKKAEDILIKEMNESDQEKLVVEFVEKVGKVN